MKRTRHAVLIGVNDYHGSLGKLRYCVRDCQRLAEVLTAEPDGVAKENLLLLTDDVHGEHYPGFGGIISWLGSFLTRPKEDDSVLVYFAGHGRTVNGRCYLAPADGTLDTLQLTGIALDFVQELLMRCKARQRILVVDACHSGAGRDVAPMEAAMLEQLAAGVGLYTIASCAADERSHEWEEKEQGVFSYYFVEALGGACPADADGNVTMDAVYDYVYERVRSWASRARAVQTPTRFQSGAGKIVVAQRPQDWRQIAEGLRLRMQDKDSEIARLRAEIRHLREAPKGEAVVPSTSPTVKPPTAGKPEAPPASTTTRDVSTWAEVLRADPDPAVVTDDEDRRAMQATGWPWRVRVRKLEMVMVLIPPGTFQMGSPRSEAGRRDDEVLHPRQIRRPFYLGETTVTQEQWAAVVGHHSSAFHGPKRPVDKVSWDDCQDFLKLCGRGLRLPSEAEWEHACRAGTTTTFSFGARLSTDQANYDGEATVDVGTLGRNGWGLYDMHGNVWEWCEDTRAAYPETGTEEPTRGGGSRVLRGGSWADRTGGCRSARRVADDFAYRLGFVGFRLARTPE